MRAIELQKWGLEGLTPVDVPRLTPARGEVLVRAQAVSLNYRDVEILEGRYGMPVALPIVPASDAVAEVVEVGKGVTRFKIRDRVNTVLMPDWQEGEFRGDYFRHQLGSSVRGVLQEYLVLPETALVRAPMHLGAEAATLPIAAVTAWNALRDARVVPGQTVLIQGTGGVALFSLQLAQLFGARTILVTTHPEKVARVQALGADAVIDTRSAPDWGERVLDLTDGRGADVIIEVGGGKTLAQSSVALKVGGYVAVVGYLGGPEVRFDLRTLFIGKRARLHGHTVGSRASFEEMNRAIELHRLQPVIDSTYPLENVAAAYEKARSGATFGKVLITL
ncbi:MAG TPA: NAD(P)-dependent alcohol dehydrogenase [Steroidobacteraceae bacterium]|nr:NAD(P)-dependent alcohol dehydrogenase [Steroidobacteraceae bacterium]